MYFFGPIALTPLEPSTLLTPHCPVTPSLCRRTLDRGFAAPLQALSLVSTGIHTIRWTLAISPWVDSIIIRWTLAVSPWDGSLAILSLSRRGMAPPPTARSLAVRWLPRHSLVVSPWKDSIAIRCLLAESPWADSLASRSPSRRWTLAYIALSHFSNVGHSSRQRYPYLSLECTSRLWWSSKLECSISFSHGIVIVAVPFNWHSESCDVRGITGCILLGAAASRYNNFHIHTVQLDIIEVFIMSKKKWLLEQVIFNNYYFVFGISCYACIY